MQNDIIAALLSTLLGCALGTRGEAVTAQPKVNNQPTQGPIVERYGALSVIGNALPADDRAVATGLTQIGSGTHSLVGEIGRIPLASVLGGIVPENFRVLLDDPNLLLGMQVSWRDQQPFTEVLTDVAGEYGIVFTLDWDQRALLVAQSDFNFRPFNGATQRPRLITGPLIKPSYGRQASIVRTRLSQITARWSAPTSLFIPFAVGSVTRVIEPSAMQAAMVAALEAAALRQPINLIGMSHATGSNTPRKRLLDYAEQRVQWVAERLVSIDNSYTCPLAFRGMPVSCVPEFSCVRRASR